MFFLRTFIEEGSGVRSYRIDVEKADDSHYLFSAEAMDTLDEYLATNYSGQTLVERLRQFVASFPSTYAVEAELGR